MPSRATSSPAITRLDPFTERPIDSEVPGAVDFPETRHALPRALSGATACEFGGAVYLLGGSSGARADEDPDIALAVFEPAPVSAAEHALDHAPPRGHGGWELRACGRRTRYWRLPARFDLTSLQFELASGRRGRGA